MHMKRVYHIVVVVYCSILGGFVSAQEADPYEILEKMKAITDQVSDYTADLEIEVDVDFIKMPVKHATIYFKRPDKVKFKSDEFIMLPKRGLNNQLTAILNEPYTAIYLGNEVLNEKDQHVIRIVPMGKNPEVILATWWIDKNDFRITKSESNMRKEGSFTIDFLYTDPTVLLPTQMIFSFEIEKLNLPLKFIGKSAGMEIDKDSMEDINQGRVLVRFSNYSINSSLPEELFIEDGE